MDYEEDVYNEIFQALKHPIRRRILKMLEHKNQTYTSLLNKLNIESGLLNYHLESLGSLIGKSTEGQYKISEFGNAALGLTRKIEEPKQNTKNYYQIGKYKISNLQLWKLLAILLIATNVVSIVLYLQTDKIPIVSIDELNIEVKYTPTLQYGDSTDITYHVVNPYDHLVKMKTCYVTGGSISYENHPTLSVRMSVTPAGAAGHVNEEYTYLLPLSKHEIYSYRLSADILDNVTIRFDGLPTIKIEIIPHIYTCNEIDVSIITDKEQYQLGETVYYNTKIRNPYNFTIRVAPPHSIDTILELDGMLVDSRGCSITWTEPFFELEPFAELTLFSFKEGNSITPSRPKPLNITQILSGGECVLKKIVNIMYEHNTSDTYSVSELEVESVNVSLGETIHFSFILHNHLPYTESFHPAPHIDTPYGAFEFLTSENVGAYEDKLVVLSVHPEAIGEYSITLRDMHVEFTVYEGV